MTVRILLGDCLDRLRELPDESVHCVVTSPPYYGLRDYGVAGQIGLEPTLDEYLAKMVEVFREVRRVLRSDGTLWLNIGDSYAANRGYQVPHGDIRGADAAREAGAIGGRGMKAADYGLKVKDLMGVPWRLAFALQADGWWLRSEIIWHKKSAMPESVTDRPTKAHEQIFLLAKSERYFYDSVAASEPVTESTIARVSQEGLEDQAGSDRVPGKTNGPMKAVVRQSVMVGIGHNERERKAVPNVKRSGNKERKPASARGVPVDTDGSTNGAVAGSIPWEGSTRNWRDVWSLGPEPFKEAHFATFPTEIPRRAIVAGTSEKGVCPDCGAPWVRITEPSERYAKALGQSWHDHENDAEQGQMQKTLTDSGRLKKNKARDECGVIGKEYVTTGWLPSCACTNGRAVPPTVLDPFGGSGTTALVADRLQRDAILIELNPEYAAMARRRISGDAPLFAEVA